MKRVCKYSRSKDKCAYVVFNKSRTVNVHPKREPNQSLIWAVKTRLFVQDRS